MKNWSTSSFVIGALLVMIVVSLINLGKTEDGVYRFVDEERGIVCYYTAQDAIACLYDPTVAVPPAEAEAAFGRSHL